MKHVFSDIHLPSRAVRWLGAALVAVGLVFPLAVVTVRAMRWLPPATEKPVALRPEMVILPGGTFWMGSPEDEPDRDDDETLRQVTVSPFVVGRTEVTQAQYEAVVGQSPVVRGCGKPEIGDPGLGGDRPVVCVSWLDAVGYCNALSVAEELIPAYTIIGESATWDRSRNGFRLLTEAEWAYTARAGGRTRWVGSDPGSDVCAFANVADQKVKAQGHWNSDWQTFDCDDGSTALAPVADRRANAWLLFGFGGNAAEWVWDAYQVDLSPLPSVDPAVDEGGGFRVIRGGSWGSGPRYARVANRSRFEPSDRNDYLGFRVARSALPSEVLLSDPLP